MRGASGRSRARSRDAGYDVLVADFRGHGFSVPPRAGEDDWSFDDLVELDLPAIVTCAADRGCRAWRSELLGHSLGGLVATAALGTGRIASPRLLVLPATAVWLLGPGGDLKRRALMTAYRGVTALFGKAPIRAIRAGTADEAATYVRQLTGWTRAARWTSLRGIDYRDQLGAITTPVLPFVGAGDWMCTADDARASSPAFRRRSRSAWSASSRRRARSGSLPAVHPLRAAAGLGRADRQALRDSRLARKVDFVPACSKVSLTNGMRSATTRRVSASATTASGCASAARPCGSAHWRLVACCSPPGSRCCFSPDPDPVRGVRTALFAGQSGFLASRLDRAEPPMRRRARAIKRKWNALPRPVKAALIAIAAGLAIAAIIVGWRWLRG